MKKGIKSGVSSSAKKIAKQAAKQVVGEPFEILKTAGKQVSGAETETRPAGNTPQENVKPQTGEPVIKEEEIKAKSKSILNALEVEMEDIRKQNKHKEAIKLREEEMEEQKEEEERGQRQTSVISGKPSRGAARGMKGKLKKLKTKAEIRMPPSG